MAKWTVDQSHSSIGFEVKHMMVSKVKGQFNGYTADVEAEDLTDLSTASINFVLDVASINTNNEDRDNHLKSADFFSVEEFPTITFTSTNISKDGDDYQVTGDLLKNMPFDFKGAVLMILEEKGITQEALALELGVDRKVIYRLLNSDNVATGRVIGLCVALKLPYFISDKLLELSGNSLRNTEIDLLYRT